jgi:molybdopterin synthase catalytic subunit
MTDTRFTNDDERRSGVQESRRIHLRVLLFGAAREAAGAGELSFDASAPATAASVLEELLEARPELRRFGRSLLVAVNEEYAGPQREVREGDEIAVSPPVSGGAGESDESAADRDFFELTTDRIDLGSVARRVVPPECGATVTLDGYVREWTKGRRTLYLVYEAYAPMALAEMRRLGVRLREKFPEVRHVGIVHRTGRLEIGETSVVISVAAPHRRAAFEACEWAIKELKRTVPVWKKEFYEGGEVWAEGEGAP